jgi:sulfopyruvate decarboxylase TPP-binding subunit
MSMDAESVAIITEALKTEGVNLVVTLPEEPTSSLIHALREDAYFTLVDAASEGSGIAAAAGASLSGRTAIFVTGVAGMLVGTWALSQVGTIFGAPMVIMASYRGDFGDATGIPGSQSLMFKQVAEPLLKTLQLPYLIVDRKDALERKIRDAIYACRDFEKPVVMLLAGEVIYP